MESNAEMMGRLTRVSESSMLLPDQAALLRWAVRRIAELEGALEPFAEFGRYAKAHPRSGLSDDLYGWDGYDGAMIRLADLYRAAALAPAPAKEGVWVRLPTAVCSDLPWSNTFAPAGVYLAESNPHGALSVRATDGTMLGIKPGEFERIDAPAKEGEAKP